MVARRTEAVPGAIERVRDPGERVPVAGVRGREGPGDVLTGQAGIDVGIVGDVLVIVVADEAVAQGRREAEKDGSRQEEAHEGLAFPQGPMVTAAARWRQS